MITKCLEIRDEGTFIPVVAIATTSANDEQQYLLRRSGYSCDGSPVILVKLNCSGCDRNATYDPYGWGGNSRTLTVAHQHIESHFGDLKDGDVVDVQFILKEKPTKKVSERFE